MNGEIESPLYVRIFRALKDDILRGKYLVGAKLPTEGSLCRQYSVSRHTVREALRLLRDNGLVSSRQGRGTTVIPSRASKLDGQQVTSIDDLLAFGIDTSLVVESLRSVRIDNALRSRTGLPVGSQWLAICGYRHAENAGPAVCRVEYFIHRDYAAVGRLLERHTGPIFPLIEDLFGERIVAVHQLIAAVAVPESFAAALRVGTGSAALELRRTYTTADDKIVQVTINTHPASRYQHSMTLRTLRG